MLTSDVGCFVAQVDGEVRRNSAHPKSTDYLVARVKPAELPDILLLLVCQAPNEAAAAEAALALLERDKKELHVLHSKCQKGSGGNGGQAGADVAVRIPRGSSVPHWFVDWCQRSSKAAKDQDERCLQQQQQAAELVMELLSVCVTFDLADVCTAVAALPAGQDIGRWEVCWCLDFSCLIAEGPGDLHFPCTPAAAHGSNSQAALAQGVYPSVPLCLTAKFQHLAHYVCILALPCCAVQGLSK